MRIMSLIDLSKVNPLLASKLSENLPKEFKIELTAEEFKQMIVDSAPPERRSVIAQSTDVRIENNKIIVTIRIM